MTAQKNLLIIGAGKFSTEIGELARLNGYMDVGRAEFNLIDQAKRLPCS